MKIHYVILFALATILSLGKTYAEEPIETETAVDESGSQLSTTLTIGYDSRYVLYGYRGGHSLWHADVWSVYPLNDKVSLNGGFWFGTQPDGTYNELDGYVGIDYALSGSVTVGFQYSIFAYLEVPFETSSEAHEYAAHVSYWGEHFSLQLRNQYDSEAKGSIARVIGGYTAPLSETVSLQLDAEAGFAFGYFIQGNRWNHALVKASLPYQVNDSVSVSPFIARTIPLAAMDSYEKYETYGGVNVAVSF